MYISAKDRKRTPEVWVGAAANPQLVALVWLTVGLIPSLTEGSSAAGSLPVMAELRSVHLQDLSSEWYE